MLSRRLKVGTLRGDHNVPSVVAVPKMGALPILYGQEAANADPDKFHRLYNWKLLLGRTPTEVESEAAWNRALARVLEITTLDELV